MDRRLLRVIPWVAVGAVMVALAGVAVARLFFAGPQEAGDAESVQDVADLAVSAAEDLDVPKGVELLCEAPMPLYRMALDARIAQWQDLAGSERPEIEYAVSDVDDADEGSFVVEISSDEEGLEEMGEQVRVFVETRSGRSCIVGIGGPDDEAPARTLSGDGYQGATSPAPSPTPSPTPSPSPSGRP